jgi:DNA polymerase-3 subunit epsilon
MDFVAIDFETANSYRGSPCEVALVRVRSGEVVETYETFLHQKEFDSFHTSLHGISQKTVANSPTFQQVWPEVRNFIGDDPIAAHSAAFDTGVIRDSIGHLEIGKPIEYFCTVVLARQIINLPSYRLPWVADALGIEFLETHRSLSDSMAVVNILLAFQKMTGESSLRGLAESVNVRPGSITSLGWKGSVHKSAQKIRLTEAQRLEILKSIPESELYEDPDFVGKEIVFTGALTSMTREDAQQRVMRAGGIPKTSVSKKTNVLVFGQQDARVLRPGAQHSGKMQKSIDLINSGASLELVDEKTFLEMLNSPEGTES